MGAAAFLESPSNIDDKTFLSSLVTQLLCCVKLSYCNVTKIVCYYTTIVDKVEGLFEKSPPT